jgi:hypothetical protein
LRIALLEDPVLVTDADVPAAPVVVVPTVTVAAAPVAPVLPVPDVVPVRGTVYLAMRLSNS